MARCIILWFEIYINVGKTKVLTIEFFWENLEKYAKRGLEQKVRINKSDKFFVKSHFKRAFSDFKTGIFSFYCKRIDKKKIFISIQIIFDA